MKKCIFLIVFVFLFIFISCTKAEKKTLLGEAASNTSAINDDKPDQPSAAEPLKLEDAKDSVKDTATQDAKDSIVDSPDEDEEESDLAPYIELADDSADVVDFEGEDADFEYKYLAVNPENCLVVNCNKYPGLEDNDLECDTKNLLGGGLLFGRNDL
ncbi:MAG: hypothetical protein ACOX8U_09295 [Bradymonadia bacterium]|jgi:hypothetical protein